MNKAIGHYKYLPANYIFLFVLAFLVFLITPSFANVYYVNSLTGVNTTDAGRGTAESNPWKTITYAETKIITGDVVMAAAGHYGTVEGETIPIAVKARTSLIGASNLMVTIEGISGQNIVISVAANATLESCGVKGVYFNSNAAPVYTSSTNVTIRFNRIWYDTIPGTSYAIKAINFDNGSSGLAYRNELFNVNYGVRTDSTTGIVTLDGNTITSFNLYGIYIAQNTTIVVRNCIITSSPEGVAVTGTYGIYRSSGSSSFTYCDIYNNANVNYGVTQGTGVVTTEARFMSAPNKDYHLKAGSPLIDLGDPSTYDPDGTRADMGADYFNQLAAPAVRVLAPNGGESYTGYSSYSVTWTATQAGTAIDHIELYYSTDGGATYPYTISTNEVNDGIYTWTVPPTPSTQVKVRAVAVGVTTTSDESDGVFTIITLAPGVTSINPSSGINNQVLNGVTVNGSNFQSGASVKLTKGGQGDINATGVSFVNTGQLTCNLDLTGAAGGTWNVVVTDPDAKTGSLPNSFTIYYPSPAVSSVSPISGGDVGGTLVAINGSNFVSTEGIVRPINVTNSNPSRLNDYQVLMFVDTASPIAAGKMRSDCGDVRFRDSDYSNLPYWIKPSTLGTVSTEIWVKVPTIEAGSSKTLYLTYGYPDLTSASNGDSTFIFYDGFDVDSIGAKWQIITNTNTLQDTANAYNMISGGYAMTGSSNSWQAFESKTATFERPFVAEARFMTDTSVSNCGDLFWATKGADYNTNSEQEFLNNSTLSSSRLDLRHNGGDYTTSTFTTALNTNYITILTLTGTQVAASLLNDNRSWITTYWYTDSSNHNKSLGLDHYGNGWSYFDYVYVRKYATIEPTSVISIESDRRLKVLFGGTSATGITYLNSATIDAVTPAHALGTVGVTVINPDSGIATLDASYTFNVPPIHVLAPNGGEGWFAGTNHYITWESSYSSSDTVNLYYSVNGGANYTYITSKANDGSYLWTVPNIPTSQAKISIEVIDGATIASDESDGAFVIASPSVYYVNPVTGSNTNDGYTPSTAWKTLYYASTTSTPGATVYAAAGNYTTATETFPISITGRRFVCSTTGAATVDAGTTTNSNVFNLNAGATLEGFTVKNNISNTYYLVYANANYIRIKNNTIRPNGSYSYPVYLSSSANYATIEGNTIYSPSTNYSGTSIYISSGISNLVVRNNSVTQNYSGGYGLYFTGSCNYITIEGNTINADTGIYHNGGNYIEVKKNLIAAVVSPNQGIQAGATTNLICSNEVRGYTSNYGVYVYNGNASVFNNTLIRDKYGVYFGGASLLVFDNIISAAPRAGDYLEGSVGIRQGNGTVTSSYNQIFNCEAAYMGTVGSRNQDSGANPLFLDPNNNDFRLCSNSPCANSSDIGSYRGTYAATGTAAVMNSVSYVSVSGNDTTGDGSILGPWKTIKRTLASTEGTVYLMAGTYNAANGDTFPIGLKDNMLLKNFGTDSVTIDSGTSSNSTFGIGNSATLDGVTVTNQNTSSTYSTVRLGGSNTTVQNCNLLRSGANYAVILYLVDGASNESIRNNYLSNPSSQGYAIYATNSAPNLLLDGNTITADYGLLENGTCLNGRIRNNKIIAATGSNYYGLTLYGTALVISNEVRGFTNNYALYLNSGGPFTVVNNTVVKSRTGIYCYCDAMLKNNIISSSPRAGDYMDSSIGIQRQSGMVTSEYNQIFNCESAYTGSIDQKLNDSLSNPYFYDAANNDYRLCSNSPCVGSADSGGNRGYYGAVASVYLTTPESYVSTSGNDLTGDGSQGNPWKTIKRAIMSTEAVVHISTGTYNVSNGDTFPIGVKSGLKLVGAGTGLSTIDSGTGSYSTIGLEGNATLEGLTVSNNVSSSSYWTIRLGSPNSLINNCRFNRTSYGNDIYLNGGADYAVIRKSVVYSPYAGGYGIFMSPASPATTNNVTIDGCVITADYGVYQNQDCLNTVVSNCQLISSTTSASYGMLLRGTGTAVSNEVRGYYNGSSSGYGIYLYGGGPYTLNHNTVVKSYVGVYSYANATVKNNIICAAPRLGSYIIGSVGIQQSSGTLTSRYNQIFNNQSNYSGTVSDQTGDNYSNPLFVTPESDNYYLTKNSPCSGTADDGWNRGCYGTVDAVSTMLTESYVSGSGNDSTGDGSLGNPWRTITRATGHTTGSVNVMAGNYTAASGESFPLTDPVGLYIKAYGSGLATIDSGTAVTHTIVMLDNSTLEGLYLKNAMTGSTSSYVVNVVGQNVRLINDNIQYVGQASSYYGLPVNVTSTGDNLTIDNCRIRSVSRYCVQMSSNTDNPVIRNSYITTEAAGYYGVYYYTTTGATLENNTIVADYGIYQNSTPCENFVIRRNHIIGYSNNSSANIGICLRGTATVEYNEIRGFKNTSGAGIYYSSLNSGTSGLINKNTLAKNQIGIYLYCSYGIYGTVEVRNNIVASEVGGYSASNTYGIYKYYGSTGTIITKYNDCYANDTNWYGYSTTFTSGEGDKALDPKFINATNEVYYLQLSSPCINGGTPDATTIGAYDVSAPAISVSSPAGGEQWQGNSLHNINFSCFSYYGMAPGSANLYYTAGDGNWNSIATGQPTNAAYAWTTPLLSTTEVKVRVTAQDANGMTGTGESPVKFTIDSTPASVSLIQPVSGETVYAGGSYEIKWIASDECGLPATPVAIRYSTNSGATWQLIASNEVNDGSYFWSVPLISSTTARISVEAVNNVGLVSSDASRNDFTVFYDTTPPQLTLVKPVGGEMIAKGLTYEVTYVATEDVGLKPLWIWYSLNSGANWTLLTSTEANDGSYIWSVPNVNCNTARISIEAINYSGMTSVDASRSDFILADLKPPTVTITVPNGGQRWIGGSTHNIVFTCSDESGIMPNSASFYYSVSGGAFMPIATGQPTDSAYAWTLPLLSTTEVKVRVTVQDNSLQTNTGTGDSAAFFTVDSTPALVSIGQPRGGENLNAGGTYEIKWTASDECGLPATPITIRYSLDSGSNWLLAASGEANDGSYIWNVPIVDNSTTRALVEAVNNVGLVTSDASPADFNIVFDYTPPQVHLLSPLGGETLTGYSTFEITWTATEDVGLRPATLRFSADSGATWSVITTEATGGRYVWRVPSNITTTEARVSIEVRNLSMLASTDACASDFTILTGPRFVDIVHGSNSNDGLSPTLSGGSGPWKTLYYANQNAPIGAAVYVAPGIYGTPEGEPSPIRMDNKTFVALTPLQATIDAYGAITYMVSMGANSIMNGFSLNNDGSAYALLQMNGNNGQVLNSYFTHGSSGGTILSINSGVTGALIKGNTFMQTASYGGTPIYFNGNNDGTVEANQIYLYGTNSDGVVTYTNCKVRIYNNFIQCRNGITSSDNFPAGIGIYTYGTAEICYNDISGFQQGKAIILQSQGPFNIYKNTFVSDRQGIATNLTGVNATVRDNVFSSGDRLFSGIPNSMAVANSMSGGSINSSYNIYYHYSKVSDETYGTFTSSHDILAYPRFFNAPAGDYRLCSDSPANLSASDGGNRGRYSTVAAASGIVQTSYFNTATGDDVIGDGSQGNPWRTFDRARASTEALIYMTGNVTFPASSFPITVGSSMKASGTAQIGVPAGIENAFVLLDNSTLEGFDIDFAGSKAAVNVVGDHVRIANCHIKTYDDSNYTHLHNCIYMTKGVEETSSNHYPMGNGFVTIENNTLEVVNAQGSAAVKFWYVMDFYGNGYSPRHHDDYVTHNTIRSISPGGFTDYGYSIDLYGTGGIGNMNICSNEITARSGVYSVLSHIYGNKVRCDASGNPSGSIGVVNQGYTAIIDHNDIDGFGQGIYFAGAGNPSLMYNNTLTNNTYGITLIVDAGDTINDKRMYNNIISGNSGQTGVRLWVWNTLDNPHGYVYTGYENFYGLGKNYDDGGVDRWGTTLTYNPLVTGDGVVTGDPQLVNPGVDNHLQATSPCIDAGNPASPLDPDYSVADKGAYYYWHPLAAPNVHIFAPNGGESISGGSSYNITWTATPGATLKPNPITISFSSDEGATWQLLASNEANDGSYNWSVPTVYFDVTTCRIKVEAENLLGGIGSDISDSDFTIQSPPAPTVNVTYPNGGETVNSGSSCNITWTATPGATLKPNPITISFSSDEGTTWQRLASNEANDGTYSWSVPIIYSDLTTCRIMISAESLIGKIGSGISNSDFTIQAPPTPTVSVDYPNGGEALATGSTIDINWTAGPNWALTTNPITIRYSSDEGATWQLVASGLTNTGSYSWNVPNEPTAQGRISVEAENILGAVGTDMSDDDFTIRYISAYYVSELTGDNSYNGLTSEVGAYPDGPWQTITYATSRASAGKPIYVMAGTYHNFINESDWPYEDFPIDLGNNRLIRDFGDGPVLISNESDNGMFYEGGNCTMEGFTIDSHSPNGWQDCVIVEGSNSLLSQCTFETWNCDEGVIVDNCLNSEVSDCNFRQMDGLDTYGIESWNSTGVRFLRNNLTGNYYNALYTDFDDGALIKDNSIVNNCAEGSAIFVQNSDNVSVESNRLSLFHNSFGASLYADSNFRFSGNTVIGDGLYENSIGVHFYGYGTVASNEIRGCYQGIFTSFSESPPGDSLIDGNTIVKNLIGVQNDRFDVMVTVKNNIIACSPDAFAVGDLADSAGIVGIANTNTGYNSDTVSTYNDIYGCETTYETITSGLDQTGDIYRKAHFVSVDGDDYHLQSVSPAIDAGDPLSSQDPDGSRRDQGCYPFYQTGSNVAASLASPNGGENLTGGSSFPITWYATNDGNPIDHIELYYSVDGGATYPNTISASLPNDGNYGWEVPNVNTDEAKVRVVAYSNGAASDVSDQVFTITSVASGGGSVPLMISRESDTPGSAVVLSWTAESIPDIYALYGDGTGVYTNEAGFWTRVTNPPADGYTVYSDHLLHLGQVGGGSPEVYYKALTAGSPIDLLPTADAVGKVEAVFNRYPPEISLFSLPLVQIDPSIDRAIGSQFGPGSAEIWSYYNAPTSGWRSQYYDGSSWTGSIPGAQVESARGYWIKSLTASREITFVGRVASTDANVTLDTETLFMLGNPYPRTMGWQASGLADIFTTNDQVWQWEGGWQSENYDGTGSWSGTSLPGLLFKHGFWMKKHAGEATWTLYRPYVKRQEE